MYVRTSMSNAALSPARARATRAPWRSAAAERSGDSCGSVGAFALTVSETLGRVRDSAQRRAACGIPDLSPTAHPRADILHLLHLVLRELLGALARVLLQLARAVTLLRLQQRHDSLVRLRDVRGDLLDDGDLLLPPRDELVALLLTQVAEPTRWTPRGLHRIEAREERRICAVELALDPGDLHALAIGERHVLVGLENGLGHAHGHDRGGL